MPKFSKAEDFGSKANKDSLGYLPSGSLRSFDKTNITTVNRLLWRGGVVTPHFSINESLGSIQAIACVPKPWHNITILI